MSVARESIRDAVAASGIPVIDLEDYLAGKPGALVRTAAGIRRALEEIGFYVIVNHGVRADLVAQTFAEAERFHALPMRAKLALGMNEHNNGYMAINRYMVSTSEVNDNDQPDLNEAFFTKRERGENDPQLRSGRRFVGPNRWPPDLPGFRERVLEYTDALDALALRLLPALAVALEMPAGYFDRAFAESQFTFRMSHYPPVQAAANQFGIAPHTDASFMTFVAQSAIAGLQVRMPDGRWQPVPYLENSFAVNSGDTLYRWTNGRFKSTPHRVVPPVGADRYAVPFFVGPQLDTVIECLPTCQGPDNPPRFPPISFGEYLDWWYDANYPPQRQQG